MIKLRRDNGDELEIKPTLFPDNTSQVWKLPLGFTSPSRMDIHWGFEAEDEVVHLAQLKMLLDRMNIRSHLHIDYLPYARQDKYVSNDTTFALRTLTRVLQAFDFPSISVYDPHSDEFEKLMYPCWIEIKYEPIPYAETYDAIVFPDAGATRK